MSGAAETSSKELKGKERSEDVEIHGGSKPASAEEVPISVMRRPQNPPAYQTVARPFKSARASTQAPGEPDHDPAADYQAALDGQQPSSIGRWLDESRRGEGPWDAVGEIGVGPAFKTGQDSADKANR